MYIQRIFAEILSFFFFFGFVIILIANFQENPTSPTEEQWLDNDDLITHDTGSIKIVFSKTNDIGKFMPYSNLKRQGTKLYNTGIFPKQKCDIFLYTQHMQRDVNIQIMNTK